MKKAIIAILMALLVLSGLAAQVDSVVLKKDYSPVVLGVNMVITPTIYTGGGAVAQEDMLDLINAGAFTSGYNANNLVSSQQNLAFGFDFYLYAALSKKTGFGLDGSFMFQEGLDSHFEAISSDAYGDYIRSFTAIEVFPHYRHYFGNDTIGWTAFKVGPNIAVTGDTTDIKMGGDTMTSPEKLQNDILYGIRAGFDAGLILGNWLMSYDFTIAYDLNKTYHSANTGYIYSEDLEDIGNRISFNIGIGYGLKF